MYRAPLSLPGGPKLIEIRQSGVDRLGSGRLLAVQRGNFGERYILGGENIDYPLFLDAIADTAGVAQLVHDAAPPSAFPKEFPFYDSRKARAELGWSSRPLAETIARSVDYLRGKGC